MHLPNALVNPVLRRLLLLFSLLHCRGASGHQQQPPPSSGDTGANNELLGSAARLVAVDAALSVHDFSPTGSRLTSAAAGAAHDEDPVSLDLIPNSPNNFRLNTNKRGSHVTDAAAADHDRHLRPWFNGRTSDQRHIYCVRPARCERLRNPTCFGSRLPYASTSLDLTDSFHQNETRERLHQFEALRNLPKCWAVVQPFLCAVFVPKCERLGGRDMVYLPSLEMCRIVLEPCRLLMLDATWTATFLPEFLRCNETLFPSRCNNDVREVKFNTTGECRRPLVATGEPSSYYADVEGCGVQCGDPLYTDDEHRQVHNLVLAGAAICAVCNLATVLTFLIDWRTANKYPAVIIFYINVCFMVNCAAWLAQFWPGNREDTVCRKDGTLRHAEPSAGENLSCIAVFLAVYYALVAAMVWFVIFTYSWHLRALGSVHRIAKKSSYFHLIAWSVPLVLTIATMALSEVDGNSIAGVCFVGYVNGAMRAGFLLGPLAGVLMLGGGFIGRGMVTLVPLRKYTAEKSMSASKKIHGIIVRMGLTAGVVFVLIVVVCVCQVGEFRGRPVWAESLRKFIVCQIATSSDTELEPHNACKLDSRPSLAVLQLQLLCLFSAGVVMSSWCWTRQSLNAWRRYMRKKLGVTDDDDAIAAANGGPGGNGGGGGQLQPKQKQKYKIIAQTYAKRKEFQDTGRLSVSFYEAHTDPAGLNFDINDLQHSAATNEMSSTWCNYLPKITRRRSALAIYGGGGCDAATAAMMQTTTTHHGGVGGGGRKSSVDSEYNMSVSMRQFSVESRRNSMESQVSVQFAEVQTKVHRTAAGPSGAGLLGGKGVGSSSRHTSSKRFHHHHHHHASRRGSSTSVESHIVTSSKLTSGRSSSTHATHARDKRMRRRGGSQAPNASDIHAFIERFPELTRNFQGMTTTSDDEEVVVAAAAAAAEQKQQQEQQQVNSRLVDVVVRQHQYHHQQHREQHDSEASDVDEATEDAESVLLGMHQQQYHRGTSQQQQQQRQDAAAAAAMLNEVRRMHPGLAEALAQATSAMPVPVHASASGGSKNSSKHSQRSTATMASMAAALATTTTTAAATQRKSMRTNSLKRHKQRKSAAKKQKQRETAAAAAAAASENNTQLIEPHKLRNLSAAGGHDQTASSLSSSNNTTSSFTSYASEFALPIGIAGMMAAIAAAPLGQQQQQQPTAAANGVNVQSSYSAMSMGRHSRSSKTSCDVGTQANAYEIATQTGGTGTAAAVAADCNGNAGAAALVKRSGSSSNAKQRAFNGNGTGATNGNGTGDSTAEDSASDVENYRSPPMAAAAAVIGTQTGGGGVSPPTPSSATSMLLTMGGSRRGGRDATLNRRIGGGGGGGGGNADALSGADQLRMLLLPSK